MLKYELIYLHLISSNVIIFFVIKTPDEKRFGMGQ